MTLLNTGHVLALKTAGTETHLNEEKYLWSVLTHIIQGNSITRDGLFCCSNFSLSSSQTGVVLLRLRCVRIWDVPVTCSVWEQTAAGGRTRASVHRANWESVQVTYNPVWKLFKIWAFRFQWLMVCVYVVQDTPLWASLVTVISSTEWRMERGAERWS